MSGWIICILKTCVNSDGFNNHMRAIVGHLGGDKIDPSLLNDVEIQFLWSEYIHHIGSALDLHSINHSGLKSRKKLKKEDKQILHSRGSYDRFSRRRIIRRDDPRKVQNKT